MADETREERLERLEKAARDRAQKRSDAAAERRIEELELEERFERECAGPRGTAFAILTTDIGNFVVKRADFVAHKQLEAKGNKMEIEDATKFVRSALVFPALDVAAPLFREHSGIVWDLVLELNALYRAKREENRGK